MLKLKRRLSRLVLLSLGGFFNVLFVVFEIVILVVIVNYIACFILGGFNFRMVRFGRRLLQFLRTRVVDLRVSLRVIVILEWRQFQNS